MWLLGSAHRFVVSPVCGIQQWWSGFCAVVMRVLVYRLLPWMRWFFHHGGVVGAPSCAGVYDMVRVASKVQIVYVLGVECLVMWVF